MKNIKLISGAAVLGVLLISKAWAFPSDGLGIPVYVWDARSLGMGGITTTLGGSQAVAANPAMLSRTKGFELLISGDYDYRGRDWKDNSWGISGADNGYLNFDALFFDYGFGKMGFGGGMYSWQEYDWDFTNEDFSGGLLEFETRGSNYTYSLAVGAEISPGFNIGIAVNSQRGEVKDTFKQDDVTEFSRSFRGYNYHLASAITSRASGGELVFSAVYKSPPKHTGAVQMSVDGNRVGAGKEGEFSFPPTYQTGVGYDCREFGAALEYTYVEWSKLDVGDEAVIGRAIFDPFYYGYVDTRTWRLGIEYKRFEALPLRMGGYLTRFYDKATPGFNIEGGAKVSNGRYLTAGMGLLLRELVDSASALSHCVFDIAAEYGVMGDNQVNTFETKFIKVMSSLRLSY